MSVKICSVEKKSVSARKGIKAGDELISINGNEINDRLDYSFYGDDTPISVCWKNRHGKLKNACFGDIPADDCGLEFETYLMNRQQSCYNKCIFCFIDQMPPGMRESLYFKDDDARLSFLFGNYITLTNLSRHDVDRIKKMHISPVNVSVHTMNPELRCRMMNNKNAGSVLSYLKEFSDAGIAINAQLVLCPDINDGEELIYSLEELSKLDSVGSIAAVPVGLTKYRENLYPLQSYTPEKAKKVIDIIDCFNKRHGSNLAFASDEFYLTSGVDFPDSDYYGDFPQLDNGVGMWVSAEKEFSDALEEFTPDDKPRKATLATGMLAAPLMKKFAKMFTERFSGSEINVIGVENKFFGEKVTVAGLITGRDLIPAVSRNKNSDTLLIPEVMLRGPQDRVFLDDITLREAEESLAMNIVPVSCDGSSVAEAFYNL